MLYAAISRQAPLAKRVVRAFNDNDVPTLIACFEEGGDPNHRNQRGDTLLHLAIERNNLELVRALSRHGACLEVKGSTGLTPLMLAASKEQLPVVQYLAALGAQLSVAAGDAKTAIDYSKAESPTWHFLRRAARASDGTLETAR
jgi:ankyrin repeat protein